MSVVAMLGMLAMLGLCGATHAQLVTNTNTSKGLFIQSGPPLESILNYVSKACGFVIDAKVPITGLVTNANLQPASCEEMLLLAEQELANHGYAVIRDGNKLTIISAAEAKRGDLPVIYFTQLENIPATSNVVSCIMPFDTEKTALSLWVLSRLPSSTNLLRYHDLNIGVEGNSLSITGRSVDVRSAIAVILATDKAGPKSSPSVGVFNLKNAEAGELAALLTTLYPVETSYTSNGAAPQTHPTGVFAIGDNATHSVTVAAPPSLMPDIADTVAQLDMDMATNHVFNSFTNVRPHSRQVMMSAPAVQTDDARPRATGF